MDREAFGFCLLSDFWPHGAVASTYDVFDDQLGCARRASFILDRGGIVRWKVESAIAGARSLADYQRVLGAFDERRAV